MGMRTPLLRALPALLLLALPEVAAAQCAWPIKASRETLNVAFPDTASTYWSYRYKLEPGEELLVEGVPIQGRYFSLNTYSYFGENLDGISDAELPVSGSPTASTRWQVVVRAGVAPGSAPGTLAASSGGDATGQGVLIYRVYVPDPGADAQGGVPLPTVSLRREGHNSTLPVCPQPSGSWLVEAFVWLFGPGATETVRPQPVFLRPVSAEGFFPNRDNKYLAALTQWKPGRVAVVQGRLPTVPAQLRYWSLCSNEYRKPYPVVDCLYDAQVRADAQGYYTVVVSTAQDRPATARRDTGINWLPWGDVDQTNVLLVRNMLPTADFPHSIQAVRPGTTGQREMGEYYPRIWYCDRERFDQLGPANCR